MSNAKLIGKNNLLEIAKLCPKLQSIDFFGVIIGVSKREMHEFVKRIDYDSEKLLINEHFYDDLISFCKVKPNTKIYIRIGLRRDKTDEWFNEGKKLFEETKHFNKLNINFAL